MDRAARSLYQEPNLYALMFGDRTDDIEFYRHLVRGASSVLEYGVGSGRVAVPLARGGCDVVGVDISEAMLGAFAAAVAKEEPATRARLSWQRGDSLGVHLGRRFPRVICPFNGLAEYPTRVELTEFFQRVHEHLDDDGLFAFDVWLPNPMLLAGASTQSPWFDDPRRDARIRCIESFAYDAWEQVLTATLTIVPFGEVQHPEVLVTRLRQFFPQETLALLDLHGFEVCWRTSRYAIPTAAARADLTEPEDARGEMMAYVCRAKRDGG